MYVYRKLTEWVAYYGYDTRLLPSGLPLVADSRRGTVHLDGWFQFPLSPTFEHTMNVICSQQIEQSLCGLRQCVHNSCEEVVRVHSMGHDRIRLAW